jgi:hypothetical protein
MSSMIGHHPSPTRGVSAWFRGSPTKPCLPWYVNVAALGIPATRYRVSCQSHAVRLPAGSEAREHWHTLSSIDKSDLAQEVYVRHVCVTLQELYQNVTASDAHVSAWLPQWHEDMLHFIAAEKDWFALQLPEQQTALFLQVRAVHCAAVVISLCRPRAPGQLCVCLC